MSDNLTTIECSRPKDPYGLFQTGTDLDVHLAGPTARGGTGPCLCGFDRHRRVNGVHVVGFSVGGGVTGPGFRHHPCAECAALADGRNIRGTHASLFYPSEELGL
ncbi:Uncharacterised protein [Mycobacteroides abscessus subsp. abscessus]|nr:Uncharacterised protein [Mycobacteroides abscessus]CPU99740.1 Uncharacterised protein [Mycobacteroides abscessus]SLJ48774.1 Uncharacterised protein [Mycobacteroides abscessus subsp. abscessus]